LGRNYLISYGNRFCQNMNTQANSFVFRAADHMRIKGCVNALTQDGISLAVCCEQEALLDHYLDILLKQLSEKAPWLEQDIYFPTNTEYLLARFNEILASQSVRDALQPENGEHEARVWIVHDAQSLPEPELQLLARLIQNFPGANIRALLVMSGPATRHPPLSAFGRKILKWTIEPPGQEQALLALEAASSKPEKILIERLLRKMSLLPANAEVEPILTADSEAINKMDSEKIQQRELPSHRIHALKGKLLTWIQALKPPLSHRARAPALHSNSQPVYARLSAGFLKSHLQGNRLALIGSGLLISSVLLTVLLQPQTFGVGSGTKKSTLDTATTEISKKSNEDGRRLASPAAEITAPIDLTKNKDSGNTPNQNPPTTKASPIGHDWAQQLAPLSFVLQHASVTTLARAQAIISGSPTLRQSQSKVVMTYRPGDAAPQYVVLSGPFDPVGQAYEKARTPGTPAGTWVRSSADLQSHLLIPAAFLAPTNR
jgi:hypothetical protein